MPLESAESAGAGHEADTQEARCGKLDGAASVFEGGTSTEGAINEAQVDLLYRQIGQLKVENDLYEGFGVKRDVVLARAAMTAAL